MVVSVKFQADTGNVSKANNELLDSLKEIAGYLKEMAKIAAASSNAAVANAKEVANANRQSSEEIKKQSGLLTGTKEKMADVNKQLKEVAGGFTAIKDSATDSLKPLTSLNSKIKDFSNGVKESFKDSINSIGQFAFSIKNIIDSVSQMAEPFKKVVVIGSEFESRMSTIAAVSDATDQQLSMLGGGMRDLAKASVFSATQVGDAGLNLARAGFTVNETMSALPGVLNLASASGEDLATSSEIAAKMLRAFGLETKESTMVADLFAKAANASNVGVGELGESMKYSAPVFAAANQSIQTLTAATSMLANVAIGDTTGGTALRMAMLRLAGPTDKAAETIGGLGLKVSDSKGKIRDFADIMADLNKVTEKMTDADKLDTFKTLFGVEATPAMLELAKKSKEFEKTVIQGGKAVKVMTTEFKEFRTTVTDSTGFADRASKKMLDNLKGDWNQLTGNMEEMALSIFDIVVPILRPIVRLGTASIQAIVDVIQSVVPVITAFKDGFLAGIEPIQLAFEGLFDALAPSIKILSEAFAPLSNELSKLFGETEPLMVFGATAYALGTVLGKVVSIGIVPLVEGIKLFTPVIFLAVSSINSLIQSVAYLAAQFSLAMNFSFLDQIEQNLSTLMMIDMSSAGRALVTTFASGIAQAGKDIYDSVLSIFNYVANLFPHSNAKEGPFSTLYESGEALIETMLAGIRSQGREFNNVVRDLFASVSEYWHPTFAEVSVTENLNRSLNEIKIWSDTAINFFNQLDTTQKVVISGLLIGLSGVTLSVFAEGYIIAIANMVIHSQRLATAIQLTRVAIATAFLSIRNLVILSAQSILASLTTVGAIITEIYLARVIPVLSKFASIWPKISYAVRNFWDETAEVTALYWATISKSFNAAIIAPFLERINALQTKVKSIFIGFQEATQGMSIAQKIGFAFNKVSDVIGGIFSQIAFMVHDKLSVVINYFKESIPVAISFTTKKIESLGISMQMTADTVIKATAINASAFIALGQSFGLIKEDAVGAENGVKGIAKASQELVMEQDPIFSKDQLKLIKSLGNELINIALIAGGKFSWGLLYNGIQAVWAFKTEIGDAISGIIKWWKDLDSMSKIAIASIAGIAAFVPVFMTLVPLLLKATNPLTLVLSFIPTALGALANYKDEVKAFIETIKQNGISEIGRALGDLITRGLVSLFGDFGQSIGGGITSGLEWALQKVEDLGKPAAVALAAVFAGALSYGISSAITSSIKKAMTKNKGGGMQGLPMGQQSQQQAPVPPPPPPQRSGGRRSADETVSIWRRAWTAISTFATTQMNRVWTAFKNSSAVVAMQGYMQRMWVVASAYPIRFWESFKLSAKAALAGVGQMLQRSMTVMGATFVNLWNTAWLKFKAMGTAAIAGFKPFMLNLWNASMTRIPVLWASFTQSATVAARSTGMVLQRMFVVGTVGGSILWQGFKTKALATITTTSTYLSASYQRLSPNIQSLWTRFRQQAALATTSATGFIQRMWIAGSAHSTILFSSFVTKLKTATSGGVGLLNRMWVAGSGLMINTWASFKTMGTAAIATTTGLLNRSLTVASASTVNFWARFRGLAAPAIAPVSGFIGRAFTAASAYTANFWARFTTQGEVAAATTGSRLSGMLGKKSAIMTAAVAGTVGLTMFSSQDASASEMGMLPDNSAQTQQTQANLESAFDLSKIKEKFKRDFEEMLASFGLLQPLTDGFALAMENLEVVGMGAFTAISMGLVSLGGAFTAVSTAAGGLAAFFVGWQIGSFLYSQFTVVQDSAIAVVGVFIEFGRAVSEAIQIAVTAVANFRFADFANGLLTSFQNLPAGISQVTGSLNEMWRGLGDVLMAPANLFSDLTRIVGTMIGDVTAAISSGNFGDAALALITGLVKGIWSVASNLTSAVLGLVKMAISAILPESWYQSGVGLLTAFWGGIKSAGKAVYDAVAGVFSYIWNLFPNSDAKEGPFSQLVASGSGLVKAFVNGILSVPTLIVDAVTGLFTAVTNYLSGIDWIGQGTQIINKLKTSIAGGASLLIESAREVFDGVLNYITSIDFAESGRKLIATIGTGIKEGATQLTQTVSDSLTAVRQYLPFSDAKEGPLSDLTKSGQSIPATLAEGVSQNSGALVGSVQDMATQTGTALTGLTEASSASVSALQADVDGAKQALEAAKAQAQAASDKVFEIQQKIAETSSRREKKQIKSTELVEARKVAHEAKQAVRELGEVYKQKNEALKESGAAARQMEKANIEAAKDSAREIKDSLRDQASDLLKLADKYKEVTKVAEDYAKQLKGSYETVSNARDELAISGFTDQQRDTFQTVKDQGVEYGPQIAQVKLLANANQELTAAKNELAKATMTESQARLFDLQQKYPEQIALEISQTQELAERKKALSEMQKQLSESTLSDKQTEYLEIMRKVGVEEGQRIIQSRQSANVQKQALEDQKKSLEVLREKAGGYFDSFSSGQMSAKSALKSFFKDVLKSQQEALQNKAKEKFLGLFGLGKENANSSVQRDMDKATQFLAKSGEQVGKASNSAAGTIAKAVNEAGERIGKTVDKLGADVNEAIQKAATLASKAESLEQSAANLKEAASDVLVGRAGRGGGSVVGSQSVAGVTPSAITTSSKEVVSTNKEIISANQKYVKVTDEVASALEGAAKKFNYSLLELSRMASLESSFNANVKNSSGYMGLFQFKGAASKEVGISGKEYDPRAAAEGAIKYWEINQKTLDKFSKGWRETAEKMNINEGLKAWMAHNQGAGGLSQILKTLTTGVNHLSSEVTRNVKKNLVGGEGKGLSGVALAEKYIQGWIGKWNKLPLPSQFKDDFQGEVSKGVVTVTAKAAEESTKVVTKAIKGSPSHTQPTGGGVAIHDSTLDVLSETTNKYIQKGVSYQLGAKNIELGKIDCSGWVSLLTKTAFENINQQAGEVVFDKADMKLLQDSSHNIIQNIVDKTGTLIDSRKTGDFKGQLREGMMIGLDKGDHGWDRGRVRAGSDIDKNIDHIVQVTVDKVTGKMGISESHSIRQGGKQVGGVAWTELDKWLAQNKKATMFATDPFKLAAKDVQEALGGVSKAAQTQAQTQVAATDLQKQSSEKHAQTVLAAANASADASKAQATAQQELAAVEATLGATKVSTAASFDQAMAAVEASRVASITQDTVAMTTHAGSTQTAGEAIVQTTGDATKQVADIADQAKEGLSQAAGQCLAEATNNPVIEKAADLKEATDVAKDACEGKSGGIMDMFKGITDGVKGFFGNMASSIGNLFGGAGGKSEGFLSSITSGIGSLFGGGKEGGGFMSTITKGIGSLFSGGGEGGGFMSSITKGIGSLFGGGGKEGGGLMSSIGSLLGGKGDLAGTLTKSLGGLMGGTEEAGKFISGLSGQLGSLTGSFGEVGKGISSLLGGGSTPGMSALSAATSLLSGDMAGAAAGAAQLLGSMTPLGPIGGMIAGKLVSLSGIGAKWVREAEWVEVSMKGMSASFGKGFKETKKGWLGGSKMGHESLDDASVKKLSDMLGETKKSIEAVSESLGMDKNGLLGKMDNFRYHIAAMENKGPEWFDKAFEKMRVMMVKSAVDNIMVAGEDIETNLGGGFKNTFKQVLDGTFSEAARAETWDGVLTKFVASADTAVKGGLQDDVSAKLGERLTEFVNASAEQMKGMPIDELQGTLTGEIGKIFTDLTGIALPESISGELAEVFATRIQDAVKLASGEEVTGETIIKDKGEAGFYKTLKSMVSSFEGTEQELTAFIGKMMETKEVFKQTGLNMGVFSEDLVKGFGDMDKFSASLGFFKDNFASVSGTNLEFSNSLTGLNTSLKEIQSQTLPGINTAFPQTREEFFKLTQSVSELGKDGEATFSALLKGAPQFANYYKAIEDFNQKFGGTSGTSLKQQAKKATDLNQSIGNSFKSLGLEVPKTRKGLFDLVQGFDLTNESQRNLHDSILKLAPALDELYANSEQVDKFRDSMRGIYDSTGGAEKTIRDLAKEFPNLNLGTSALTLNTKEAARQLATMSEGELMAWAESMGLTGLSIEDITQKTTDYLNASSELQTNIGSFKDEMHKLATGATDNEAALTKLKDKYPQLSESLENAGMTATQVAGFFDQMSPEELQGMADALGVTVETLMADTQTYIGILQEQSNMFSNINGESLGGDLMKVLTDANVGSAAEAGKMFADNFTSQFYNQMISTVLNGVMQTIYQGVVEPFLSSSAQAAMNITEGGAMAGTNLADAGALAGTNLADASLVSTSNLTTGSTVAATNLIESGTMSATNVATGGTVAGAAVSTGGLLAADALAAIVADAKQKIQVMGQVMSELKSSGALDQIGQTFSTVGETAYNTINQSPAAPYIFQARNEKTASEAAKEAEESDKASAKEAEKQAKEEAREAEKQAKEEEKRAKEEAREQEAAAKKEAQEAAKAAAKNLDDFRSGVKMMSLGLEGNAKVMYELNQVYGQTSAAQYLNADSSKELMASFQNMSIEELQAIATATGQEVSKVTGDFLGLVDMMKQSEKAMGEFRNKMAVTAGTTTEYQLTLDRMKESYPSLTALFADQSVTSKELATQLSTMNDGQLESLAASLGVTVEQLLADGEAYVGALKAQEEAMKSFRDSLQEFAAPEKVGKQQTINQLDSEFAGLGLAAKAMTLDTKEAAKAMLAMPDDQLVAFAEQYGLTTDQLKEKTTAYFGAVNELQQGMDSWRDKMGQMATGESDASLNVKNLSQKSPYLTDLTQGMDAKGMAKFFSAMDNTQIEQLANQYGVSVEKFEADTESWVNSTKTIEEDTKNLAQGFIEFRTKMSQIASGTTDAQVSIEKLAGTYSGFSEVQGKSSKELATYFSTMSDADIASAAVRFGVTTDQFKADAETLVSSTQSIEEATKTQAEEAKAQAASMREFRDSLAIMSGSMTENEVSLKNLSDKYPALSGIINDSSLTAKEAAERFNSLSDDELKALAASLGTDFDTLKADASTWLGVVKSQDEALKESTKSIADFQNEMRKTAGVANDSQVTMEGLTAKYPMLSSAINDSSMTAKEAATQFATMDMEALMDQLGIYGEKRAEFLADSQAWVGAMAANDEAVKSNREAMVSYTETMLKATGTYGDNDIALKNLTASYPTLASTINSSSMSAKDAATYFSSLSDTEFESLAKSLNKTTDELRTDSTTWVNTMAANEESFNSFHSAMLKLGQGMTDNEVTLNGLADKYPSLSQQILNSGQTAQQAATQFANMSDADLDALAASLGVTTDVLKADIQSFVSTLPTTDIFASLRTGLDDLINPLTGAEKTITDLANKYPALNLATNAMGVNVTEAATAIKSMTDEEVAQWATGNGIAADEAKEATLAYLGAVKELQGQIGSFKDRMHQLATGMTDNEATMDKLKSKYPSLADSLSKVGVTAQEVGKQFDSMNEQQIADMAKSLNVSVETLMADVDSYIGVLNAQAEETKAQAEKMTSFRDEMSKLGGVMSANELVMSKLTTQFPGLITNMQALGGNSKDAATQLAKLDDKQLADMAAASKMTTDQFLENATTYINTLASQEEETKSAINSVKGMQNEFKKMTSGMTDSQFAISEVTSKYPGLISSLGLSGKTAEEVAGQFASMAPDKVVEMAKGLGVSTDEFIGDVNSYVGALKQMGDEAKAITDSLNGFKDEMDRMGSSLKDADYTIQKTAKDYPSLTGAITSLGRDSKSMANALANMDTGRLESMAKSAGVTVDEFINSTKGYISAVKSNEEETAKLAEEAAEKAKQEAEKAAEEAKKKAEAAEAEVMKQIDKFFDVFNKLADKMTSLSDNLVSDIQSFDTQSESLQANRRAAQMKTLQASLNDLQSFDLAKEVTKESPKAIEKAVEDLGKYRKLVMDESKYKIEAINKEKEATQKAHEEIIGEFNKLVDSLGGTLSAIGDDIDKINTDLNQTSSKVALRDKARGEFAQASAVSLQSTQSITQPLQLSKPVELDAEAIRDAGLTVADLQKNSAALAVSGEAAVQSIKAAQEASRLSIEDGKQAVKLGEEYRKAILAALEQEIDGINKAHEATQKKIEEARDKQVESIEKTRDEAIKALEKESEEKQKTAEKQQDAAKKLREEIEKIQDAVASFKDSLATDIEKLAKDMSLAGTSTAEKLAAIQDSISQNMPVTEASVKKLEEYKSLVLESLNEQIEAENKRFEEVQKTQQTQRDHYKKLIDFSKQLKGFLDDLKLGELSTFNPAKRLEEARRQYEETMRLAKGGDETAMGEVSGKAQAYLKEAQSYYASSDDYAKIFDDVNENVEGMRSEAEKQAAEIAKVVPIDETETGKAVANLLPLQQAAYDKLQAVDSILGVMDRDLTGQLANPAATPIPDEQFTAMQESQKEHFTKLIESQKTDTDKLIEQTKTDADKQIQADRENSDKQINGLREAARDELQKLDTSLVAMKVAFEAEAAKTFDDTAFAVEISAVQQASLGQLIQLGNYLVAMDMGIKDSLNSNISALMTQLSPEKQLEVAQRLDEAMQRNITGPLRELIGAVKGEKVKAEIATKEKGFANNQTAIDNAVAAFADFRGFATKNNINASFDEIFDKLAKYSTQKRGTNGDYDYSGSIDNEGIKKMLQSDYGFKGDDMGGLGTAMERLLVDRKDTDWDSFWPNFKANYLQTNKEFLAAFQAKQDDAKAIDLAKYRELNLAITGLSTGLSQMGSATVNKGRTESELYTAMDKRSTQLMIDAKGIDVKIDTYDSFLKAKETLEGLKKSLMGVTDLKADLDGLNGKLATTKSTLSTIPKVDIAGFTSANVGTMKATSIQDYLAQLPQSQATPAALTSTATGISNVANTAVKAGIGSSPVSIGGSVSSSGAKDIIIKLDNLFIQWKDLTKVQRDDDLKSNEKLRKEATEQTLKWRDEDVKSRDFVIETEGQRWATWRAEELAWRGEDLAAVAMQDAVRLMWRNEDLTTALMWHYEAGKYQKSLSDLHQYEWNFTTERDLAFHNELVEAINGISISVTQAALPATETEDEQKGKEGSSSDVPSFDVGTPYVAKDMPANVHKGEIIIDPEAAGYLRKYGIRAQANESGQTGNSKRIEELLTALLTELKMGNQSGERRDSMIANAVNNMGNTVAAPVVAALKKGQQPTLIRK
jgi:chromosome segregation ATPase